jgi:hypothetical protein
MDAVCVVANPPLQIEGARASVASAVRIGSWCGVGQILQLARRDDLHLFRNVEEARDPMGPFGEVITLARGR